MINRSLFYITLCLLYCLSYIRSILHRNKENILLFINTLEQMIWRMKGINTCEPAGKGIWEEICDAYSNH